MSNSPERADRPVSAAEAQARFEAHLDKLQASAPRSGMGLPTARFIDNLVARARRWGKNLFACFDDPRIPATTNDLERLFGRLKQILRRAVGCGSTMNTVASNLGADVIRPLHALLTDRPTMLAALCVTIAACTPAEFTASRKDLAQREQAAIRQRSMTRHFDEHVEALREQWFDRRSSAFAARCDAGNRGPPDADA